MIVNKKIIMIFTIFCILLSLIVSYAIFNSPTSGSFQIMSFGSSSSSKMKASFMYFSGTKQKVINLKAGEEATINFYSKISEGQLTIKLLDSEDNVVKQFESNVNQKEKIKAYVAEKYKILVEGDKARGKYEISWHK